MTCLIINSAKLDVDDGFLILRKAYQLNNIYYDIVISDGDRPFEKKDLAHLDPSLKEKIRHIFFDCYTASAQQLKDNHDLPSSRFTYFKEGHPSKDPYRMTQSQVGKAFHGIGQHKPKNYPAATINEQMAHLALYLSARHKYVMKAEDLEPKNPQSKDTPKEVDPKAKVAPSPKQTEELPKAPEKDKILAKPNYPEVVVKAPKDGSDQEAAEKRRRDEVDKTLREKRLLDRFKGLFRNPALMQKALQENRRN